MLLFKLRHPEQIFLRTYVEVRELGKKVSTKKSNLFPRETSLDYFAHYSTMAKPRKTLKSSKSPGKRRLDMQPATRATNSSSTKKPTSRVKRSREEPI